MVWGYVAINVVLTHLKSLMMLHATIKKCTKKESWSFLYRGENNVCRLAVAQ